MGLRIRAFRTSESLLNRLVQTWSYLSHLSSPMTAPTCFFAAMKILQPIQLVDCDNTALFYVLSSGGIQYPG